MIMPFRMLLSLFFFLLSLSNSLGFFVVISADDLLVPPHDTNTDLTDVMEQINSTFPACCKCNKMSLGIVWNWRWSFEEKSMGYLLEKNISDRILVKICKLHNFVI